MIPVLSNCTSETDSTGTIFAKSFDIFTVVIVAPENVEGCISCSGSDRTCVGIISRAYMGAVASMTRVDLRTWCVEGNLGCIVCARMKGLWVSSTHVLRLGHRPRMVHIVTRHDP